MKELFYIYLFIITIQIIFCNTEDQDDSDEGNILLPMDGKQIEITFQGKKIGNKNYFTTPLKVGTPEKTFNVQIDTSVSTCWLPSVKCKNCVLSTTLYNESESSTSSNPSDEDIELDDEDGDVEGYKIDDDISLNGYKLQNFSFIQVTELDEDFRDHFDGKLGLGYRGQFGKNYNFLDKLKKDKLISKKIFSINQISDKKGLLFIGDLSARKYTYCNVSSGEDLDDIYKESWVCDLTHVGIFNSKEGISNKLHDYTLVSDGKVDFDSAYEYIAVPISYRQIIEDLLFKANLICETNEEEVKEKKKKFKQIRKEIEEREEKEEKEEKEKGEKDAKKEKKRREKAKKEKLMYKINDEEISIKCKTTPDDLSQKGLSLSFILQGNVYSIPLDTLFSFSNEIGKMVMKVKLIDDDDAIWTFGYPFMNQFLMIFNMEDNHVGMKRLKKTSLPVINVTKEWSNWHEVQNNFFYKKMDITSIIIIAIILFIILIAIVGFLVWRAYKKSKDKKPQEFIQELNNMNNGEDNRVY